MYIRPISIKDNLSQYMRCVESLNSNSVSVSNTEQIKRALSNRHSNIVTYVLLEDDKIIATATCIFEKKLRYNQPCCHIEDVGTDPDYRGLGYGKIIVDHCVIEAKLKNCYKVKLFCSDKLIDFYNKLGFQKINNGMELIIS